MTTAQKDVNGKKPARSGEGVEETPALLLAGLLQVGEWDTCGHSIYPFSVIFLFTGKPAGRCQLRLKGE